LDKLPPGQLTLFLALYVLAQVVIGIWAGRGAKSETDYYLGGRGIGFRALTLSIFATWFGAETILGSAAAIAEGGLSGARAEPFGYAICLVLMALFVAGPIRKSNYVTISDFFRERYGKKAEIASAVVSVIISVIWAGAQLLAVAAILETVVGIPGYITLLAAAGIVIVYCYFAGLKGDIATDIVQGVFLIIGIIILFMAVADRAGGVAALIASIKPEQLRLVAEGESMFARIDNWMIPVIGSLVTQEALTRFLAAKSTRTAQASCIAAACLYLALGMLPVLIGLGGTHLGVPGAVGDNFIPAMALELLPTLLAIVLVGALFSAILSTVDSNLLAVSSLVSINLMRKSHGRRSEKEQLQIARLTTVAAGLGALGVAFSGSNIYELLAMTSIFGQGGILVATMIGLRSSFGGAGAALASLFACVAFNLATLVALPMMDAMGQGMDAGKAAAAVLAGDISPIDGFFLWSIVVSIVAYVAVAAMEKKPAALKAAQ
jgi:SSS family transporter